ENRGVRLAQAGPRSPLPASALVAGPQEPKESHLRLDRLRSPATAVSELLPTPMIAPEPSIRRFVAQPLKPQVTVVDAAPWRGDAGPATAPARTRAGGRPPRLRGVEQQRAVRTGGGGHPPAPRFPAPGAAGVAREARRGGPSGRRPPRRRSDGRRSLEGRSGR